MAKSKNKQNKEVLPIVAIDLGSNCVRAMAARAIDANTLQILGVEKNPRNAGIKQGVVDDTGNASCVIHQTLTALANRIGMKELRSAFIVLGGCGLTLKRDVALTKDLISKHAMTSEQLQLLEQEFVHNLEERNPKMNVLGLFPVSYVLDQKAQDTKPQPHQTAEQVEIHYDMFYGSKDLKQKPLDCLERACITTEQSFVRTDALLSAIISDDEAMCNMQDGCALIDLGAQTTTLTVYKGSQYLFSQTIGKGGLNITRAIEQAGIPIQVAEKIKQEYGYAAPEYVLQDAYLTWTNPANTSNVIRIKQTDLATTIQEALDEIILPLLNALKPFENRLTTIYLTGGGSMLNGILEYVQEKTPLNVLYGNHAELLASDTEDEYYLPEYTALVGALIMGADYRRTHKPVIPEKTSFLGTLKDKVIKPLETGVIDFMTANKNLTE